MKGTIANVWAGAGLPFLMLAISGMAARWHAPSDPAQPAARTFLTANGNQPQKIEYGSNAEK